MLTKRRSSEELRKLSQALALASISQATTDIADKYLAFQTRYFNDPTGFILECIKWRPGEGPTPYQLELAGQLLDKKRLAVRGPHGLGKTAFVSWIILWFALTRDGKDWKIPTTASAWRQLTKFLWPEIKKWGRRLNWEKIGRDPFNERLELLSLSLKLETGEAFALASDKSDLIEGAHADYLLYIFDEAKAIPDDTFNSAEGAFSTGEAYCIAISTPGEPQGRFYQIHKRAPGYEDWHTRKVTTQEAIDAGRLSQEWVDARARQWGVDSAVYQNRVAGEFATSSEDAVISLAWVEAANERWEAWVDAGRPGTFTGIGVDVGRGGDPSVIARRYGNAVDSLTYISERDIMPLVGRVKGILTRLGGYAVIDVIGVGAGVYDRGRELGLDVRSFNAGERATLTDKSGELGFVDTRSAAWWSFREMLQDDLPIALPPDDRLTGDLTAPKWRVMSGGRIKVESKDEIKKRLKRSTDSGDAVIMVFYGALVPRGISLVDFA